MSLFSIKTAPVPLDAETYIGEKREYSQRIPETELIALTENNYIPLTQAQISVCAKVTCITVSIYCILNRSELCECSLTAGNYLLSYTNINCGHTPEARDGYFTTYYSFNKIVLDVISKKFDIQVDESTKTQAALLHDDIPGYEFPTINYFDR